MILLRLAARSLRNRVLTTSLTVFSIALSVFLILGVERVRRGTEDSFANTLSQTDLIVGARGAELQLLLYTVFHMGEATNNIDWKSYSKFRDHPATAWTIPISLGDSFAGYRVVATDGNFYEHYRFRGDQALTLGSGRAASDVFDVVLGSEVARKLKLSVDAPVVISHGMSTSLYRHQDKPFHVVGTLKPTGTPIDRALYITLEGMEALHMDWKNGAPPLPGMSVRPDEIRKKNVIKVGQITSFLLRTKNRIATLRLQREINFFEGEPLMSIIPGVALSRLWDTLSVADIALRAVSGCVALVSLLGMLIVLYASLNERRREMAILRALGLQPARLLFLMLMESGLLVLLGMMLGAGSLYGLLFVLQPWLVERFGLFVPIQGLSLAEWGYLGVLLLASLLLGCIPAVAAYRRSLSDGLSVRV